MSLVVTVRVNDDEPHAFLVIQRTAGGQAFDDINTYHYVVHHGIDRIARGEVKHRYGAGSLSLLATVCRHAQLEEVLL